MLPKKLETRSHKGTQRGVLVASKAVALVTSLRGKLSENDEHPNFLTTVHTAANEIAQKKLKNAKQRRKEKQLKNSAP